MVTSMAVLWLVTLAATAFAQSDLCYYPNGDWAKDGQAPCSSGGGNCCPQDWQCLSNGLCHYEPQNLTGRYTCTDRTWQSDACTQICTNGNTAIGNEAILHCYDDVYCCNGNGSLDCCNHIGQASFQDFRLPSGSILTTITSVRRATPTLASITNSAASVTDGTPLSTIPSSTSTTSRRSSAQLSSSTVVSSFTTTGSNGQPVTRTQISIITITAPASGGGGGSGSDTGRTIGLAVGIPVGVILLGAIGFFFYLRRRRQQKMDVRAHYAKEGFTDPNTDPDLRNSYGHFPPAGRAPEIDSFPVANTRNTQGELLGSVPGLGGVPPAPATYSDAGTEKASSIRGINEGHPVELDSQAIPVGKAELPGSSPLSGEKQG